MEDKRQETRRSSDRLLQKTVEILRILERIHRGEKADFTEAYADLVGMKEHLGRRREDRELGEALCASIEAIARHLGRPVGTKEPRRDERPLTIRLADLPAHPVMARTLANMALLYAAIDDFENARNLLNRALEIDRKVTDLLVEMDSDEERIRFLRTSKLDAEIFLSLVVQYLIHIPSARKDALDVWLKVKGRTVDTRRRLQEILLLEDDPQALKTYRELSGIKADLLKHLFDGPGKEGPSAYNKRIEGLESQKGRLEVQLRELSGPFAARQKIEKADVEEVAGALPDKTVLVEFARAEIYDFNRLGTRKGFASAHYLAFVLHVKGAQEVRLVDLGDAAAIDRAVTSLKRGIGDLRDLEGTRAAESSRVLYDLVFAPLGNALRGVRDIFICPDGRLNILPFEVLQDPQGRYLIEDYTLNYLTAGRDVLGFGQTEGQGQKALLVGDPDFDMEPEEKGEVVRRLALREEAHARGFKRSSEMSGLRFARLPETREEVRAIRAVMGAKASDLHIGRESLEEVLWQSQAPAIVHLATHGFFLGDVGVGDLAGDRLARAVHVRFDPKPMGQGPRFEDPLLRSGIVLAGANAALKSSDEEHSEGILTAEKILDLRLRGTEMVVLSACDSGPGEGMLEEAVRVLPRSFTQAGAKGVVMTMWSMPHQEIRELMVEFYGNIVAGDTSRCQALRRAALRQMRRVKERYGHTNPRFWGGFVFVGEP